MKIIFLSIFFFFSFIYNTYALPIWFIFLWYDFFIVFLSLIGSLCFWLFFYFKRLNYVYKIIILFLVIFLSFIFRYTYTYFSKEKIIKEYINNINSLWLYDLYYEYNWYLIDNYDRSIDVNEFKEHYTEYILVDIREKSELFYSTNIYNFKRIRFPQIIKNYDLIFPKDKKILISCIDWNRGRIASSFLWKHWYNSYYLEWWFSKLWVNVWEKYNWIDFCSNEIDWERIFVWINDEDKESLDIPYMQLTEDDVKKIIDYFENEKILNKSDKLILLCNQWQMLNCWVW